MEGKSRQNRIVNNRIPFERFVRLFAMIEIVLTFLYAKYFATFSVYGSRIWVLVIIVPSLPWAVLSFHGRLKETGSV